MIGCLPCFGTGKDTLQPIFGNQLLQKYIVVHGARHLYRCKDRVVIWDFVSDWSLINVGNG